MFVNTESLQIVNLGNCTDANNLFDKSQEYNLIILGNEDINTSSINGNIQVYNINETINISELIEDLSYITGEGEKCRYCDDMFDKKNVVVVIMDIIYLREINILKLNVKNVMKVVLNVMLKKIQI